MIEPKVIRRHVLTLAYTGQTAHVGCALSIIEILCTVLSLYPNDIFILSKGHGVMALYACQYALGKLSKWDFDHYMKGSKILGLNEDPATGSLGHGLPIAVGQAYALRLKGDSRRVFCLVGDGEMQEGSCWEAIGFIARQELDNITILVDANGYQAMCKTETPRQIQSRLWAFGLNTAKVNGHSIADMSDALTQKHQAIVCETIKGRGVSFMENDNSFHYKRMTPQLFARALAENAD